MLTKYLWVFLFPWYHWWNCAVPLLFRRTAAAGTFFLYCGNYRKYAAGAGDLSVCTESSGMGSG